MPAGSMIETIFFSLALGLRIRTLENERNNLLSEQESTLANANQKLETSNQIKDHFLSAMSHELRTPMNGIVGNIDLLKTRVSVPEDVQLVDDIRISALRMTRTIGSILDFTEVQQGCMHTNPSPVSLRQLASLIEHEYVGMAAQKSLDFSVTAEHQVPQKVYIDGSMLEKTLILLIDNAIKFTQKGQVHVIFKGEPENDHLFNLTVLVIDTGRGIAERNKGIIFEAFKQTEGGLSRRYGGVGIGLPLAAELAKKMGGDIKLLSSDDNGSCFSINLSTPILICPEPVSSQLTTQSDRKSYSSGLRATDSKSKIKLSEQVELNSDTPVILVVEDDRLNQLVLKKMLQKQGVAAVIANNGQEALDKIKDFNWDMILMDCQMPVMDGITATYKIRELGEHFKEVPIIVITANASSDYRSKCLEAGMNDYLTKPLRLAQLKETLNKYDVCCTEGSQAVI